MGQLNSLGETEVEDLVQGIEAEEEGEVVENESGKRLWDEARTLVRQSSRFALRGSRSGFDYLPLDCLSEVVTFFSSARDFFNIYAHLSLAFHRSFRAYLLSSSCPNCCENVTFHLGTLPVEPPAEEGFLPHVFVRKLSVMSHARPRDRTDDWVRNVLLVHFPALTHLDLSESYRITDRTLQFLAWRNGRTVEGLPTPPADRRHPKLVSLALGGCSRVTDAGLTALGPDLRFVDLCHTTKFTAEGMRSLEHLESIVIAWTKLDHAAYRAFASTARHLTEVDFRLSLKIDSSMFRHLHGLPIRKADLSKCSWITSAAYMGVLASWPLRSLNLEGSGRMPKGPERIEVLSGVEELIGYSLGHGDLEWVSGCKRLLQCNIVTVFSGRSALPPCHYDELRHLKSLENLDLVSSNGSEVFRDIVMEWLGDQLKSLSINMKGAPRTHTPSPEGLKKLTRVHSLRLRGDTRVSTELKESLRLLCERNRLSELECPGLNLKDLEREFGVHVLVPVADSKK